MLGQHRQLAQHQRQFTVAAVLEVEGDAVWVVGDDAIHIAVVGAIEGRALLYQGVKGEDHVVGGDRCAVMKARFGA